jgi:hypothetical protein
MSRHPATVASVVIPAHDEEAQIAHTLSVLAADASPGELEVLVVCNGCSDGTARVASELPGVTVVEIPVASKVAALRMGDRLACTFPRIYLDADVELTTAAARAVADALARPAPAVAGVGADIDLTGSSWGVRRFYEFRQRLPVLRGGVIGAGVYALNASGRARFGEWPDVLADDQLVLRLFGSDERLLVADHRSRVTAPRNLRAVVRRGVRVRRGNQQLDREALARASSAPSAGLATACRESMGSPRSWVAAVVFAVTTLVIRMRCRWADDPGDWERQETVPHGSGVQGVEGATDDTGTRMGDAAA